MIRPHSTFETPAWNSLYHTAPRVDVRSHSSQGSLDLLAAIRNYTGKLEHFSQSECQLLYCDVLLYSKDNARVDKVLMRSSNGLWVDVTNATVDELLAVAQGDVVPASDPIRPIGEFDHARRVAKQAALDVLEQ